MLVLIFINSIFDDFNRQCEAVLTPDHASLTGQQLGKQKIVPTNKKMDLQQRPQKLRKTKKRQNKKQSLMTQPTLEKKNKIKEVGQSSQATLKMTLQIIHEFKATVHQKHVERITNPQRKKSSMKKKKIINLFKNISEFALQKVIYGIVAMDCLHQILSP